MDAARTLQAQVLPGGNAPLNVAGHPHRIGGDGTLHHSAGRHDYAALQVDFPLQAALHLHAALAADRAGKGDTLSNDSVVLRLGQCGQLIKGLLLIEGGADRLLLRLCSKQTHVYHSFIILVGASPEVLSIAIIAKFF